MCLYAPLGSIYICDSSPAVKSAAAGEGRRRVCGLKGRVAGPEVFTLTKKVTWKVLLGCQNSGGVSLNELDAGGQTESRGADPVR